MDTYCLLDIDRSCLRLKYHCIEISWRLWQPPKQHLKQLISEHNLINIVDKLPNGSKTVYIDHVCVLLAVVLVKILILFICNETRHEQETKHGILHMRN